MPGDRDRDTDRILKKEIKVNLKDLDDGGNPREPLENQRRKEIKEDEASVQPENGQRQEEEKKKKYPRKRNLKSPVTVSMN